ncbi:hypothetical protein MKX01_035820, partial [Papaver californicum]
MDRFKSLKSHPKLTSNQSLSVVKLLSNYEIRLGQDDFPFLNGHSSSSAGAIDGGNKPRSCNDGAKKSDFVSNELIDAKSTKVGDTLSPTGSLQITNVDNSNPKNWGSLFPLPIAVNPQPSMKFTPPVFINGKRVVDSQSENYPACMKNCEDLIVGFFIGKKLSFYVVQLTVYKLWKLKKE